MQEYLKNRHQFPHDELEKYAGKYVAWSPDGTRIVASDDDPLQLKPWDSIRRKLSLSRSHTRMR